ncbi:MAG TPA: zf-HC2 domain-containing protein [Solirubrobacterales bacterium]|nr:zf-HC2 domain-containing protein [Solirubrobacterales bacterium]
MRVSTWRRLNARRDHRWARRRIPYYVDRELASRQRRRLYQHERLCRECRHVIRTLGALQRMLPSLRPQAEVAERTATIVGARIAD